VRRLAHVEVSRLAQPVLNLFWQLDGQRGHGWGALQPITIEAIGRLCDLRRFRLSDWQLDALLAMDRERLASLASGVKAPAVDPNRKASPAEIMAAFGIKPRGKKGG
jgi:hypothetical protein